MDGTLKDQTVLVVGRGGQTLHIDGGEPLS
jgi:hypothetical protein